MRKPKQVAVVRGSLTGVGLTKSAAHADLDRQIEWALAGNTPFIESRYGHLIIIGVQPNGWESMVLSPESIADHGKKHAFSCLCGQGPTRESMIESGRNHAAQNAWTHAANDAEHVAVSGLSEAAKRDLERWIKFQRDYKKHLDAGKTPNRAHGLALGYMT